jgi:predicted outer membrane repeat protein
VERNKRFLSLSIAVLPPHQCFFLFLFQPAGGGAIYNQGGLIVVNRGGGFFDNTAAGNGGAILTSVGTVRLGNVTMAGNNAELGDAIASLVSIVTLNGTRFEAEDSPRPESKGPPRYLKENDGPGDKAAKVEMDEDDPDDPDDPAFSRNSKYSKDSGSEDDGKPGKPSPAPVLPPVPSMAPTTADLGKGNLIYIVDDMPPSMSFIDCATGRRVAFCGGIDVVEIGRMNLNTNCRENGRDELSEECEVH